MSLRIDALLDVKTLPSTSLALLFKRVCVCVVCVSMAEPRLQRYRQEGFALVATCC